MTDPADGIDLMRRRMARAQRVPPAARKPASPSPPIAQDAPVGEMGVEPPGAAPTEAVPPARAGRRGAASRRPRVAPGDPPVNLAIRVRRPLDDHLVEIIHDLRKQGVRTSKVELIEMLLWEMPAEGAAVRRRLTDFRQAAPRSEM